MYIYIYLEGLYPNLRLSYNHANTHLYPNCTSNI